MTENLKLMVVKGNVAAMKNLISEIQKSLELAEAELADGGSENNAKCLRCVYGSLSGIQTRVDALKSFADATVNIGWVEL